MANSKVVWSEGMLLTPQHMQRSEIYLENFTKELQSEYFHDGIFGLSELEIDDSLLSLGKFGIKKAKGVFKDGTPFMLEHELVIDIPEGSSRDVIYLALPVYKDGTLAVQFGEHVNTRYKSYDADIYDNTEMNSEPVKMQMANLNISLKLGSKIPENYLVIPVAEVSEYVSGASVVLNKAFVPQCLDVKISGYMQDNINLIYDKLQGRIYQISSRMNNSNNNKSYQSMIRDYMWMSALGEWVPVWREYSQNEYLKISPKDFYFRCISMLGSMYGLEGKIMPEMQMWNFNELYGMFSKLFSLIHECLREVQSDNVTYLPWDTSLYASRHLLRAMVMDRSLYRDSSFVLVVSSPTFSAASLVSDFPKSCKLAGNSEIANIVINALSGVPMRNLSVAPSELKSKNNAAYFEIDTRSELWQNIVNNDEPIALHIDDRFSDLTVELNVIK